MRKCSLEEHFLFLTVWGLLPHLSFRVGLRLDVDHFQIHSHECFSPEFTGLLTLNRWECPEWVDLASTES